MKKMNTNYLDDSICRRDFFAEDEFKEKIPPIVEQLAEGLRVPGSQDHVGYPMIPSNESVAEIIELMFSILYPGYFGEQEIDYANINFYLGEGLNRIYKILAVQIIKCLLHECTDRKRECTRCIDDGKRLTIQFLERLPYLRKILAEDVKAVLDGDPAAKSAEEVIFCYPGLYAITVYRISHELHSLNVPMLPRMISEYAHSKTGVDIHPGAKIGCGFFIDHATGVVIGETSVIGNNVRIYQGVTLGALSIPHIDRTKPLTGKKRHPTIEDNVIIYANSTILGGDTVIGKNSIIGGNVWISHSIPENTKVVIEEPKQRQIVME